LLARLCLARLLPCFSPDRKQTRGEIASFKAESGRQERERIETEKEDQNGNLQLIGDNKGTKVVEKKRATQQRNYSLRRKEKG
jgi:hypothetical protein